MAKATGKHENENRAWTAEDDEQLKALVNMGTRLDLVALVFKRSRRGIIARLQRAHTEWWQASGHPEARPTPEHYTEPSERSLTRLTTVERKIDNLTAMMHRLLSELTGAPKD